MAAKSILNEFYQRLRTAAPIYKTQASANDDGFVCALLLPAVPGAEDPKLQLERTFEGSGSSKKEAEHTAANAAVQFLQSEGLLRPEPSRSCGSTSSASTPVGSKRSNDADDDDPDNLEGRLLEALVSAYPRGLNGAQLAKTCGHFKLKSKVNHLLYVRLRGQGLVELLGGPPPPAWRASPAAMQQLAGRHGVLQATATGGTRPLDAAAEAAAAAAAPATPSGQAAADAGGEPSVSSGRGGARSYEAVPAAGGASGAGAGAAAGDGPTPQWLPSKRATSASTASGGGDHVSGGGHHPVSSADTATSSGRGGGSGLGGSASARRSSPPVGGAAGARAGRLGSQGGQGSQEALKGPSSSRRHCRGNLSTTRPASKYARTTRSPQCQMSGGGDGSAALSAAVAAAAATAGGGGLDRGTALLLLQQGQLQHQLLLQQAATAALQQQLLQQAGFEAMDAITGPLATMGAVGAQLPCVPPAQTSSSSLVNDLPLHLLGLGSGGGGVPGGSLRFGIGHAGDGGGTTAAAPSAAAAMAAGRAPMGFGALGARGAAGWSGQQPSISWSNLQLPLSQQFGGFQQQEHEQQQLQQQLDESIALTQLWNLHPLLAVTQPTQQAQQQAQQQHAVQFAPSLLQQEQQQGPLGVVQPGRAAGPLAEELQEAMGAFSLGLPLGGSHAWLAQASGGVPAGGGGSAAALAAAEAAAAAAPGEQQRERSLGQGGAAGAAAAAAAAQYGASTLLAWPGIAPAVSLPAGGASGGGGVYSGGGGAAGAATPDGGELLSPAVMAAVADAASLEPALLPCMVLQGLQGAHPLGSPPGPPLLPQLAVRSAAAGERPPPAAAAAATPGTGACVSPAEGDGAPHSPTLGTKRKPGEHSSQRGGARRRGNASDAQFAAEVSPRAESLESRSSEERSVDGDGLHDSCGAVSPGGGGAAAEQRGAAGGDARTGARRRTAGDGSSDDDGAQEGGGSCCVSGVIGGVAGLAGLQEVAGRHLGAGPLGGCERRAASSAVRERTPGSPLPPLVRNKEVEAQAQGGSHGGSIAALLSEEHALQLLSRLQLPETPAAAHGADGRARGGSGGGSEHGSLYSGGAAASAGHPGSSATAPAIACATLGAAAPPGGPGAAAAAAAALPSVEPAPADMPPALQREYEARMSTVRQLVAQLGDALQGLQSIREQAAGGAFAVAADAAPSPPPAPSHVASRPTAAAAVPTAAAVVSAAAAAAAEAVAAPAAQAAGAWGTVECAGSSRQPPPASDEGVGA